MQMTNEEIVTSYKQAKNKKEQVKILSELNSCSQEDIINVLLNNGVDWRSLPRGTKVPKSTESTTNNIKKINKPTDNQNSKEIKSCNEIGQIKQFISDLLDERSKHEEAIVEINKQLNSITEMITPAKQFIHSNSTYISNNTGGKSY